MHALRTAGGDRATQGLASEGELQAALGRGASGRRGEKGGHTAFQRRDSEGGEKAGPGGRMGHGAAGETQPGGEGDGAQAILVGEGGAGGMVGEFGDEGQRQQGRERIAATARSAGTACRYGRRSSRKKAKGSGVAVNCARAVHGVESMSSPFLGQGVSKVTPIRINLSRNRLDRWWDGGE